MALSQEDVYNIARICIWTHDLKNKSIETMIKDIKKVYPEIKGYENELHRELCWLKN